MKLRGLASRVAFVAAAAACAIGSEPGWKLEASAPPGAPTATPTGGQLGLLATVESSQPASIACSSSPTKRVGGLTGSEYFCPPGGTLGAAAIHGKSGEGASLCGGPPKPSPYAFLRMTRVETVATWSVAAEHATAVTIPKGSASTTVIFLVSSEPVYRAEARVEPPSAGKATASYGSWENVEGRKVERWHVEVRRAGAADAGAADDATTMTVTLRGTAFGPCRGACTPPGPEVISVALEPADAH